MTDNENRYINFKTKKTAWFFLLSALDDIDDRHLYDLTFCLNQLLSSNIKQSDIYLFLDVHVNLHPNLLNYLNVNKIQFQSNGKLTDFMSLPNNYFHSYENAIVSVLGHGSGDGLVSTIAITPYALVNKIKSFDSIKNSLLCLGQCYAGIFNYLKVKDDDKDKQQLTIIGATELQVSLSSTVIHNNNPWCGNLFFYYLFTWFGNPVDMDGDGNLSILDAYKYTGFNMNMHLKKVTENCLTNYMKLYTEKISLQTKLAFANAGAKKNLRLEISQKESEMDKELSYFTIKQDSWILNANHSRIIGL